MYYYDERINDYFIKFLSNSIELEGFKKWFESNKSQLEYCLEYENFIGLCNIDFSSKDALNSVKEEIQRILDTPTSEHIRISEVLTELINQEESCVKCCRQIYEDYCNGYHFLKEIALISICYDFDHRLDKPVNFNGLLNARPIIIQEAAKLLESMKIGEIMIVEWNWVIDKRK
ncbi:MAG: hypothetical protein NAG76_16275 [Candidatus Pristimantibacillus lignocellulolyticus]|uniref:Uncharacterized protein n=1 Tax=Candidatus Pristimantibacillus lignocellulolyticus TaxID=2994561 RepID=A0A9J6ZC12_9BACL|nr:MAG: hypothetical protein NAG76_16275 [Candidatus Pristimantibacillus lignocellulolyticus]